MSFPIEWAKFVHKPRPLTGGDKYHVFLSYRSVKRAWVLNLYDVLRAHGHEAFLDQCVLKAGDPLIKNLELAGVRDRCLVQLRTIISFLHFHYRSLIRLCQIINGLCVLFFHKFIAASSTEHIGRPSR